MNALPQCHKCQRIMAVLLCGGEGGQINWQSLEDTHVGYISGVCSGVCSIVPGYVLEYVLDMLTHLKMTNMRHVFLSSTMSWSYVAATASYVPASLGKAASLPGRNLPT